MVTVAVLGVVGALAVSALTSGRSRANARSEVRGVYNALKKVQSQVKTRARLTAPTMTVRSGGLTVDTPTTYSVWVSPNPSGLPVATRRIVQAGSIDAASQVTITNPAAGAWLTINSDGSVNSAGNDQVIMRNAESNRDTIITVSVGGDLSLQ